MSVVRIRRDFCWENVRSNDVRESVVILTKQYFSSGQKNSNIKIIFFPKDSNNVRLFAKKAQQIRGRPSPNQYMNRNGEMVKSVG